ncbi:putative N-acetylmannosamine-6-phosphate 2-epimerase [Pseudactinotalea sp. HY160]|uniref:N-acetylmannosamine-6-phosphate 2-epimerase n=1 Tax=Pseudactinotalea sp. HY160 TaxID=2654490 RepID=UPI00128B37A4|nr:N-acetylmannosamine-6-phosphate 2-epimerase [Pseudactinotalea sp. HY160]MPV48943.1 putative N-acetylmannosamine-6-phosphate 2-epimerase [Pseudactinotalea sp. HY160]
MTPDPSLLDPLRGRLVVSCQAYPGEPMRTPETMRRVAQAAVLGGAAAIRAQGLDDIREIAAHVTVPVIGLVKEGDEGVFITPTLALALDCVDAGAAIVAIDGTDRPRPDGRDLDTVVAAVHEAGALVMADCATVADAVAAARAGADLVGTTLGGYAPGRPRTSGPDLDFVREAVAALSGTGVPVMAEGRIHSPADVAAAYGAGAHSVTVGTAITHPSTITGWFVAATPAAGSAAGAR